MASFLSFVYRRQTSAPSTFQSSSSSSSASVASPDHHQRRMSSLRNKNQDDNDDEIVPPHHRSFLPPGVTSSNSSESGAGWVSPGDSSEEEGFLTMASPFISTPEGLLPRKSADSLRRELRLSPRALEPAMHCGGGSRRKGQRRLSGVAKILAGMDNENNNPVLTAATNNDDAPHHHQQQQNDSEDEEEDNMILPPPDYLQRTRRQPTFDSSSAAASVTSTTAKSPMVSTSSFYSRNQQQDRPLAMSPVLLPGQARTAVGALVALREAANSHPNAVMGATVPEPSSSSSYPPPLESSSNNNKKLQKQDLSTKELNNKKQLSFGTKKQEQQQQSFSSLGVLPPRTDLPPSSCDTPNHHEDHHTHHQETEDENVPYLPVNTPTRRSTTMDHHHHDQGVVRRVISEEDDDMYASPSSMQLPRDEYPLSEAARKSMDTSFSSSRAGLLVMGQQARREAYDFDPIQASGTDDTSDVQAASSKSSLISLGKVEEKSDAEEGRGVDDNIAAAAPPPPPPGSYPYRYDEEEEFDGALMSRKYRNQQMRKQMQLQMQQQQDEESPLGVEEHFEEEDYCDYEQEEAYHDIHPSTSTGSAIVPFDDNNDMYAVQGSSGVDFEEALVRRKARNQRHEKEAFLMDVVARLRDNLELVADIENAASSTMAAMGTWFVKTPMNKENLMTGFSVEQRDSMLASIDSILQEMDVAQPEEFILSPSKIPIMATTHDTLAQALMFCRTLVASAIPFNEKRRMVMLLPANDPLCGSQKLFMWKCLPELHSALGLIAPQTPETVRGGGTSLFSLPEESGAETPHTSNVSMATSITSANTPHRRRNSSQSTTRPQLILQQDGLQLRHTVEVVSSLLQKLTLACLQLKELNCKKQEGRGAAVAQTYVRACEEIKQNYLQLLDIKKEDARALTDIFYMESLSPHPRTTCNLSLTREVSVDEDDAKMAAKTTQVVALANALAPTTTTSFFPEQKSLQRNPSSRVAAQKTKSILRGKSNGVDQINLFSPSTEDMRSSCSLAAAREEEEYYSGGVPLEFDDLRRQVGSYDRDEDDCSNERRDGPSFEDDDYGSRDDSETSEWSRRMYHNVSLAASSIRSLSKQQDQRE